MAALNMNIIEVSLEMLQQSIKRLDTQLSSGPELRAPLVVEMPNNEYGEEVYDDEYSYDEDD